MEKYLSYLICTRKHSEKNLTYLTIKELIREKRFKVFYFKWQFVASSEVKLVKNISNLIRVRKHFKKSQCSDHRSTFTRESFWNLIHVIKIARKIPPFWSLRSSHWRNFVSNITYVRSFQIKWKITPSSKNMYWRKTIQRSYTGEIILKKIRPIISSKNSYWRINIVFFTVRREVLQFKLFEKTI